MALTTMVACEKGVPTMPDSSGQQTGEAALRRTAALDSANAGSPLTTAENPPSTVTTISLRAGDSIHVTVTSNECSGNPETVKVYGVISGVVAAGSCAGGLVGQQITMGPASADGTIYFTATHQDPVIGEGTAGPVTGAAPDYTVYLDDGITPPDYNDVIIAVHVLGTTPRLDCTPNQQRGITVRCTAGGAGVAVTGWSFTGSTWDGGGTHNLSGPSSGSTWEGIAVAGGTVSAQVTINGTPRPTPLTTTFAVQDRTSTIWHWQKPRDWTYSQGTGLDCYQGNFYYNQATFLGWNARKGTCDGAVVTPLPRGFPNSGYTVQAVTSGPNTGLWYVTSVSYRIDTESNINSAIKAGSPTVFQLVDKTEKRDCNKGGGPTITSVNFYTFNTKCRKVDLTGFFNGLWKHEGYGVGNNSGHQAQLEIAASLPDNDLYALEERVFSEGEGNTRAAVVSEADRIAALLVPVFASHTNVNNNWSGWVWRWYPPSSVFFSSFVAF